MREESYRALPSADRVLRAAELRPLLTRFARQPVTSLVREALDEARQAIGAGAPAPRVSDLVRTVLERAAAEWQTAPRPVINATGVILHTNLGRAPLSDEAISAVGEAAAYADLELSLESGEREARHRQVERLMRVLTGAEAAHVASNAAAAVTLSLAAIARGKEVLVSRGQAVEIGGGFRIPAVLRQSGARLVDVGTTNRTRLSDFAEAISPRTAAILHVHASNFQIIGFAESVALQDLARLAHGHGLPLIADNGSGALLDTARFGLKHEPTPVEALEAGADIVAFSGDKLLGGPQAGLILGPARLISRIAAHPMARAMRPDKMVLAALSATLLAYVRGDAETTVPVWRMIAAPRRAIADRASRWRGRFAELGIEARIRDGESTVGGGSLPGETLPTSLVVLPPHIKAKALRSMPTPVIAITRGNRVHLDPRTVLEDEEEGLFETVGRAAGSRATEISLLDSAT
jgi:L-seryl-tRNA(Ser) seleniumtransferase